MDRRRGGTGREGYRHGKWSMPGFSMDHGGGVLVAGRYAVETVQSWVTLQVPVDTEIWLAVGLRSGKGEEKTTSWMQSNELQRRAAGNADWLVMLRGKVREGWSVEGHNWECNRSPVATGHGLGGAVVWWMKNRCRMLEGSG